MALRIVSLKAENFKRLRAVDITPNGDLVFIGGRNAQGKTSVLDAIWAALGGGDAARAIKKPIRDGEDSAIVTLDLGEYVVTRKWSKDDAGTLTVTAASGAKLTSPQAVLDKIVGAHAFDPLAFTRLKAKEQVVALLELVEIDLDLDELAGQRLAVYDERTEVGRRSKALGDPPTVKPGVPDEEVSAKDLIDRIQAARETNRQNLAARERVLSAQNEVTQLEEKLALARTALVEAQSTVDFLPADVDVSALDEQLASVEETNQAVRANAAAKATRASIKALDTKYAELTTQIETFDKRRSDALASAKFPVAGLSFDDDGVTLNGIPFSQASSAEQLKVSTALAIAANPTLRVLRILDGSLLDSDSLRIIAELAGEHDYQVWIEVVDESGEVGVVIEDGVVKP